MDIFSRKKRSKIMSAIRAKDTEPEILVRKMLYGQGYRFRLHRSDLPGKPDIVLPKYRTVVFVHGCFWHRHKGCSNARIPSTNRKYWLPKLQRNVRRFAQQHAKLRALKWNVVVVWECEIEKAEKLPRSLRAALNKCGSRKLRRIRS